MRRCPPRISGAGGLDSSLVAVRRAERAAIGTGIVLARCCNGGHTSGVESQIELGVDQGQPEAVSFVDLMVSVVLSVPIDVVAIHRLTLFRRAVVRASDYECTASQEPRLGWSNDYLLTAAVGVENLEGGRAALNALPTDARQLTEVRDPT